MSKFKHCGRGVCAAEAGHKGTCAQASGWDEFTADVEDRAYESGLADGRAEAVAKEPEWEYTRQAEANGWTGPAVYRDEAHASEGLIPGWRVVRRRKAGPWVPVKN